MERFRACFAEPDDPRTGNALDEMAMIALLATLSGAATCIDPRVRFCRPGGVDGRLARCKGF